MKNVYGYIRVSTAKQGEGVSLTVQKEAIERYANQYCLTIIKWFEEKETAAKQGRPLFMAMMRLLKAKKAKGVIIHKIDRSARNLKDWADLGNLIDQGVEVHFAHESLDLQARGGRLSADIQAVIAADYIRNLRQEAIKGIYGRLKQGIYPFQAPIGYVDTGKGKCKTIDPVQGPLVRKAFELYATRKYTLKTLLYHMHQMGLRNIKKNKLHLNSLSLVLNNPFYIGIIRVKGVSFNGGHEPLVSPDLFKRVQAILRGNTNQRINKHAFKFRKLLACKSCGYSLIAETQKGHTYYRCHTKGCVTKGMREVTIDNLLLKAFSATQLYPQESAALDELLQDAEQDWVAKQEEMLTALKLQSGQIEQKLERLTDCYVDGGLDKETFEHRKEKLLFESKAKQAAESEIQLGKEKLFRKIRKFLELGKDLKKSYETGISEEQREFVQIITSNLVVEGKKLMISMRSPFAEMANRHFSISGAPQQDARRKEYTAFCYIEQNTSPIIGPLLSKEALKELFEQILAACQTLPDFEDDEP
jgi:site-specific DNA recombinase